jgi:TolB-like protein
MMRRVRHVSLCIAVLAASGCAQYYYGERGGVQVRTDVLQTNYEAADRLLQAAPLDPRRSVLVSTIVSVDRLNESSRLGRLFSEQIAGRLVQRGVPVTEVRLREQLALQPSQGELLLSRELREVSQAHDAQAVVVGTYAVSGAMVYVSLKIVNPQGNQVVAASDYALPVDDNIRGLLQGR